MTTWWLKTNGQLLFTFILRLQPAAQIPWFVSGQAEDNSAMLTTFDLVYQSEHNFWLFAVSCGAQKKQQVELTCGEIKGKMAISSPQLQHFITFAASHFVSCGLSDPLCDALISLTSVLWFVLNPPVWVMSERLWRAENLVRIRVLHPVFFFFSYRWCIK